MGITSDRVAIDTGTSLIGAPTTAVDAIFAQIPGARPADDPNRKGYYYVSLLITSFTLLIEASHLTESIIDNLQFPCDTTVRVAFTFNSIIWSIHPSDFNLGRVGVEGMCLGAFFSLEAGSTTVEGAESDDGPAWIVGDTFLKNVYSIFRYDNPRAVGFARLSDVAKGMSNVTSTSGVGSTVNQATALGVASPALLLARMQRIAIAVLLVMVSYLMW